VSLRDGIFLVAVKSSSCKPNAVARWDVVALKIQASLGLSQPSEPHHETWWSFIHILVTAASPITSKAMSTGLNGRAKGVEVSLDDSKFDNSTLD